MCHRKYSFVFYIDAMTRLFCKYTNVTGPHRWRLKVSHVKWIFTCDTFMCQRCEANFYMWHLQASRVRTCDTFTCHWCLPVTWVTAQYTILHCDILDGFFYRRHGYSSLTETNSPQQPTNQFPPFLNLLYQHHHFSCVSLVHYDWIFCEHSNFVSLDYCRQSAIQCSLGVKNVRVESAFPLSCVCQRIAWGSTLSLYAGFICSDFILYPNLS